jgi:hypothetical protein
VRGPYGRTIPDAVRVFRLKAASRARAVVDPMAPTLPS